MKAIAHIIIPFVFALSAFAQDAAPMTATTPAVHGGTEGKITAYTEESKKGEANLVFLGDSITEGWKGAGKEVWAKAWAEYKPANFGIGGDRTEHILHRLDKGNLQGLKPKAIVLMIGTNNTGHRREPAAQTAAGVQAILQKIATITPDAQVLLLGIFPRGEKADDPMRVQNAEINKLIEKMADNKKVHYLDISAKFLGTGGVISREIMPDVLHLSQKGYQIWADAIKEKVAALMK